MHGGGLSPLTKLWIKVKIGHAGFETNKARDTLETLGAQDTQRTAK